MKKTHEETAQKIPKAVKLKKKNSHSFEKSEAADKLFLLQRDLALKLNSVKTLNEAFNEILDATFKIGGIDCGGIYVVKQKLNQLQLTFHKGLPKKFVKSVSNYSDTDPEFKMVQEGKPIYGSYSKIFHARNVVIEKEKLKALAIIPIKHENTVIAVMNLASHGFEEIGEYERYALEAIAAQVGEMIRLLSTEETLRREQENFQSLFNSLQDFLFVLNIEGQIIHTNPIVQERLGYSSDELSKMHVTQIHPPEQRDEAIEMISDMLKGTEKYCQIPLLKKDGDLIPVETRVNKGYWNSEEVLFGISRDITDQTLTKQKLEKEYTFRTSILRNAAEGLCVCHPTDTFPFVKFTLWNNRMTEITGYTMEEINRRGWYQTVYPDPVIQKRAQERMANMRLGENLIAEEWEITCADGSTRILSISSSIVQAEDDIIHVLALMNDVTQRKKSEKVLKNFNKKLGDLVKERTQELKEKNVLLKREIKARKKTEKILRESEEKYRSLINISPDAIALVNLDRQFIMINPQAVRIHGYKNAKEILALDSLELIAPEDREKAEENVKRIFNTGVSTTTELQLLKKDGRRFPAEVNASMLKDDEGKPIAFISIIRDISLRKKLEEEAIKVEKLESTGVLAGGIAHDFNNLLTAILGNVSFAKMDLSPSDKIYKRLSEAEEASYRAKALTQQLLTFAKGGIPVKKNITISELLQSACNFALSGSNVKSEFSLAPNLSNIEADEGQINQVIHNIVINAVQAMPNGGIVSITVKNHIQKEVSTIPLKPGKYVKIIISDQGIGIPKEYLSQIFDPYFTTKEIGHGLGLTTTYSILKKHEGFITATSKLGKGTTFYVYLPSSNKKARHKHNQEKIETQSTGRILIMDDEEFILELTRDLLISLGFDVSCAKNGEEAINLYNEASTNQKPFDMVIMDLTIPGGMGGTDAIQELRKIDNKVKAIVSSGYTNDPVLSNYKQYGFCEVIRKPFRIQELKEVIQQVLNS